MGHQLPAAGQRLSEVAATEALRYQERVKQIDYENQQERVIDAAMLNLELNKEALYDTYTTSEELRALQDNLFLTMKSTSKG